MPRYVDHGDEGRATYRVVAYPGVVAVVETPRRHEIDTLRLLATRLLIVFPAGTVFTAFDTFDIQGAARPSTLRRIDART